jgi:predicted lysophospholipase L1 biosynthesis ABC-type transport system permease subunit
MALEPGRGATAVPVRTTLVSAAMAVALLVATLSFGASLRHLADTPVLQGWNWDVSVGNPHSDDIRDAAVPALGGNPDVAGFSGLAGPEAARINGHDIAVMGVETVKGSVLPPMLEGRAPAAPDEIALAARDLRDMHAKVGQRVSVEAPGQPPLRMRVVGRMVLTPSIVNDQVEQGQGGLVTMDTFKRSLVPAEGGDSESSAENVFVARFKPGVQRHAALARLQGAFPGTVLTALRPSDVENLRRVSALPSVLAALFAAVAMVTVGHMLVSSVRRRRHDVAILRTMGFVRRQVAATVAWQANTIIVIGLVFGLPIGVAVGRWTWGLVANQLGVRNQPVVPVLAVAAVAVGSFIVATVLASVPGLVAARTRPAEILRAE